MHEILKWLWVYNIYIQYNIMYVYPKPIQKLFNYVQ